MSDNALSRAVWGEMYLKVQRELTEQHANLYSYEVDNLVEFRLTQLAQKLVALLDSNPTS